MAALLSSFIIPLGIKMPSSAVRLIFCTGISTTVPPVFDILSLNRSSESGAFNAFCTTPALA